MQNVNIKMQNYTVKSKILRFLIVIFIFAFYIFNFNAAEAALIVQAPKYIGLNSGLVGYWSFDGKDMAGVKAYDRSGQGNDGTLTNGPASAIGRIGQALSFDGGEDYVRIPSKTYFQGNQNLTISLWFKYEIKGTGFFEQDIITKKFDAESKDYSLRVNESTGAVLWGSEVADIPYSLSSADTVASPNTWYHYVAILNKTADVLTLYINGVQVAQDTTFGSNSDATSQDIAIGSTLFTPNNFNFVGSIDDVRIYNRALSGDEIKRLYKIGATLKVNTSISNDSLKKGLVGHWSFDGPTVISNANQTYVEDLSGQNNRGQLMNMSTSTARVKGKIGQALSFDGSNDFVVNDASNIPKVTISAWINIPNYPANNSLVAGFSNDIGNNFNDKIIYVGTDGKVYFYVFDGGSKTTSAPAAAISPNTWHHVVGTANGNNAYSYVDGVLVGSVTAGNTYTSYSTPKIFINGDIGIVNRFRYLNGKIDDVRVYNRALSGDEIKRLYKIGATLKVNTSINNDSLKNGLVGYWSFDGKDMAGGTAYDRSGNSNNGTLTPPAGGGPIRAIGKIGQGLSFDGVDDYVSVGDNDSLDITGSITVATWVRATSFGVGFNEERLVFKGTGVSTANIYTLGIADSKAMFSLHLAGFGASDCLGNSPCIVSNTTLVTGRWYHVAGTYDGATIRIYVDGQLGGSQSVVSTGTADANPVLFGSRSDGQDSLTGFLDDVRLYNRALTPAEIKRLYNMGR